MDFQAKEFGMTWRRTAAVPESFGENIIIDSATAVPTDKAVLSFVRLFFAVKTLMSMPKMQELLSHYPRAPLTLDLMRNSAMR